MARAFPASQPTDYDAPSQPGDWQALRGELEALLDQVEGQYAPASGASDAAFAGFAQRMRDLRYQVAETDPDDRRREALKSVKRQIERFNDRDEPELVPHADSVLQSAIQQIRSRTQGVVAARGSNTAAPQPLAAPAPAPRFDELSQSMAGLSGRLAQFEAELKTQRGNAAQVKEIADQVAQLSHVMELLAGAVGETGQVKRLEGQIAGLAQLMTQAQKPDLTQMTERLDALSATVDRLADLQVQQIQHVVLEAEAAPQKGVETTTIMQAIEEGVRSIYDRIDRIESSASVPQSELERISAAMAQISARLGAETGRPERLLGLVDALNNRINEVEDRGDGLGGLKNDIEALRGAIISAIEPRFASIETRLGDLGDKLQGSDGAGIAQIEAQIRQLVARMDQTGEQLSGLAQLYSSGASDVPDFEALANLTATRVSAAISGNAPVPPDFEALATLAATRVSETATRNAPAAPDFNALAEMVASRTSEAVTNAAARNMPAGGRMLTEAGLAEFEARITRLVDGLTKGRAPENAESVTTGMGRVEERLSTLESALTRRIDAGFAAARATLGSVAPAKPEPQAAPAALMSPPPAAKQPSTPAASPVSDPIEDVMPRDPAAEAPLKEFGFPDLGPVRAALEAKNGPRKLHPGIGKLDADVDPHFEMEPITPEMAGGITRPKASQPDAVIPPPDFDPSQIARPPRPESSLDSPTVISPVIEAKAVAAPIPAPTVSEVSVSSRNTFIEAARRAAQRQNQSKPQADANSVIGRAFARFQQNGEPAAAKPAKMEPTKPAPAPAGRMVTPEPPPPEMPAKPSRKERQELARAAKKADALQLPADAAATAPAERADASKESFLVRHRKPILLGASLIAVLFMAANLVLQRLSTHGDQPIPATTEQAPAAISEPTTPATPAPATARPDTSSSAAPSAAPSSSSGNDTTPAPKPISEAIPLAAPITISPVATPASPRIVPTDPTTTASITPALSFAPSSSADTAMPPALAATNTAAAAVATSATSTSPTTVSVASTDTSATAADAAPAAMESPVKVEMPPAALGPEELRQAAANGDAHAQFEIAAIYSEGRAVPQDYAQAEAWYERAAAQGFGPAQYRLGNLYENGKGVTKDLEQARLWYQRSAEAGNRMAMHNLAALYAGGQLGKQDFPSAAEWFERAANLGMKDSQFNLGMLYARGLGVPQNLETSYQWFALAAATGDADAAKARDNIGRSLDAAAIKRLTATVAAWRPTPIDLAANFAPIGTWEKTFNPGPAITDKGIITKVQVALVRLGYDIGAPSGKAGPKTADAIKAFERGTGMSEVGVVNPRLLAVLGSQPV